MEQAQVYLANAVKLLKIRTRMLIEIEGFEHWLEICNTSRGLSPRTKAYRRQAQLALLMLHQAPQLLGCLREIVLVQCEELQLLATAQIVQQSSRPDLVEVVPCQIQLRNRRERAILITPRHLCDTERGDAIVPQAQFLDMGAAGQAAFLPAPVGFRACTICNQQISCD